jgi:hypothetical protein
MRLAKATKLHRKSGASPSFFFSCKSVWTGGESIGKRSYSTHVRESPRTWGTRPGNEAWWEAGKAEEEITANTPNRSKVVRAAGKHW